MGYRPVLLLSRDDAYDVRDFVIVSAVTTRFRNIPAEVLLGPEDGLPRSSVVNLDTIDTIPKVALQERIGVLTSEKAQAVNEALRFALGLD
jgi:mRNA interferase MazF